MTNCEEKQVFKRNKENNMNLILDDTSNISKGNKEENIEYEKCNSPNYFLVLEKNFSVNKIHVIECDKEKLKLWKYNTRKLNHHFNFFKKKTLSIIKTKEKLDCLRKNFNSLLKRQKEKL